MELSKSVCTRITPGLGLVHRVESSPSKDQSCGASARIQSSLLLDLLLRKAKSIRLPNRINVLTPSLAAVGRVFTAPGLSVKSAHHTRRSTVLVKGVGVDEYAASVAAVCCRMRLVSP